MKYRKVPISLIAETKRIIRLHHFLRYDCGLRLADELTVKDFKKLLSVLVKERRKII